MDAQDFEEGRRKGLAGIFISQALKFLLDEKHLYQNLRIDESLLRSFIRQGKIELDDSDVEAIVEAVSLPWKIEFENRSRMVFWNGGIDVDYEIRVAVPTANIFCDTCKQKYPFNADPRLSVIHGVEDQPSIQWFFLSYQCQNCKDQISKILLSRRGTKVFISGRDPIEFVPPPTELPDRGLRYFSSATIAYNAGQTLAGLFLLRTFIEQYWLTVPQCIAVKELKNKPTGDELGTAYNTSLPEDFRRNFPSLLAIYDELSGALHEAREDAALFEKASSQIIRHFQARKVFNLD